MRNPEFLSSCLRTTRRAMKGDFGWNVLINRDPGPPSERGQEGQKA
uniref:Uncharacterized protein n=1 Tax=Lepeophtheirus salmonis TaxID=72036 RepID=A0A0K2T624_LEPSM